MIRPRRLLVLTRHTPLPWEDGSGAYLFDILSYLSTHGFRVTIAWTRPHDHLRWKGRWAPPAALTRVARLRLPGAWSAGRWYCFPGVYWQPFEAQAKHRIKTVLQRFGLLRDNQRPARNADAPVPSSAHLPAAQGWMSPPAPDELAFADRAVAAVRPDVVLANYAWMLPAIPSPFRGLRACVHSDIAWQRAAHAASPGAAPELTAEAESRLLASADVIAAISANDGTELARLAPRARIAVTPKSAVGTALPPAAADCARVLFVGSGNAFNIEGLAWFLSAVWPEIVNRVPAARLEVCGSISRACPQPVPSTVTLHGMVPDLEPFYRQAAVVVAPLLHATGLNIKLIEAAGYGRAIVATSITLHGAPFLRDAVATADTASAFADAAIRLLQAPEARDTLSAQARAAVASALSPEACYGPLSAALCARP